MTSEAQGSIYVALNRFYELLEIPTLDVGERYGWNICDIADDYEGKTVIEIFTNRTTQTPDPQCLPCTVVDYDVDQLVEFE